MSARSTAIVALIIGIAACPRPSSAAACRAAVLSGTFAGRQLACHAAVVGTANPVDGACLADAVTRFEARAGCVAPEAVAGLRTAAEEFVGEVSAAIAGSATPATRSCAVQKLRLMGRAARGALRCQQRALNRTAYAIGTCRRRGAEVLPARWAALGAIPDCATDDLALHASDLDGFARDAAEVFSVDPSPYVGTYDVTFVFDPPRHPSFAAPLGRVTVGPDGELLLNVDFNLYDGLSVQGWLSNDEVYFGESSASYVHGGDVFFFTVGQLGLSQTGGEVRIVGSAEILNFLGNGHATVTFTMTRPSSGTPASLGGAYVVGFDGGPSGCLCSSASTLDLTVSPDGTATSTPATDALPDDTVLGTFTAGTCSVSPGAVVRCRLPYDPVAETGSTASCAQSAGGTCPIYLQGALPVPADPTGRGELAVGGFLPLVRGIFTVTR